MVTLVVQEVGQPTLTAISKISEWFTSKTILIQRHSIIAQSKRVKPSTGLRILWN